MKTKHLLTFILLLLALTGCAKEEPPEIDTTPTLPSFAEHKTPWELLNEAIDKAEAVPSCTIQYGTVTEQGEETIEDIHTQSVSAEKPLDLTALYASVPDFPTNKTFLADFCSGRVRVIPSNDGTFRYELADLNWAQFCALMYGPSTPEAKYDEFSQLLCTVAMETDADSRFSRLEVIIELYQPVDRLDRTVTVFLEIEYPEA